MLVPVALDQAYSYRVPHGLELEPGDLVRVPLGAARSARGGLGGQRHPDPRLHNRLKDVVDKLDVPPLKPELRTLVDWVAVYTLTPRGMVLRMACGWASTSVRNACGSACVWSARRHRA